MDIKLEDVGIMMADSLARVIDNAKGDLTQDELDMVLTLSTIAVVDCFNRASQQRGFEVAKGFEDKDIILPRRSTMSSAGYDFFAPEAFVVEPKQQTVIHTGVKAFMLPSETLEVYIRSSIGIKKNIMLANQVGLIDSDYYGNPDNDGEIVICLYNYGEYAQGFDKGDKIAQGVFRPYLDCGEESETVDTTRTGGIGSTGK